MDTFRTTPEGNEIKDFNVGFSFIKNQIKNLVCKRQNLGEIPILTSENYIIWDNGTSLVPSFQLHR